LTRRFDIGPLLLALGAILLLVGLFLDWYGGATAWDVFELTDVLLAALAVAALVAAVSLVTDAEWVDRRALPWIVGAALVLVAAALVNPPLLARSQDLGLGAWVSFAAALLMVAGAVLTFGKVSLAVNVEGRDRRRRVAAVDNRPPPTETGTPVRPGESLLHPQPEQGEAPEA
jgi:hypothetical protein